MISKKQNTQFFPPAGQPLSEVKLHSTMQQERVVEIWCGFCWEPGQRWMLRAAVVRVLGSGSLWDGEILVLDASRAIGLLCGLDEIRSGLSHTGFDGLCLKKHWFSKTDICVTS